MLYPHWEYGIDLRILNGINCRNNLSSNARMIVEVLSFVQIKINLIVKQLLGN